MHLHRHQDPIPSPALALLLTSDSGCSNMQVRHESRHKASCQQPYFWDGTLVTAVTAVTAAAAAVKAGRGWGKVERKGGTRKK